MDYYGIDGTVRASFGIYNTEEDIDILVEGIGRAIRLFHH
jgi:cysteine desulfurase/selenocysteine lyase